MSFALSSIVRTRHKKTFFSLFFLLLLCPLLTPSGVKASESRLNSAASPNAVGRASGEFDNVDSFSVFPSNRWDETTQNGGSAYIVNGLLEINNTGNGAASYYYINRDLRDLDGTIKIRFKYETNTDNAHETADAIQIGVLTDDGSFSFYVEELQNSGNSTTKLLYTGTNGLNTLSLPYDEQCHDNTWYVMKIDYDFLLSVFRWRLFFDNNSKVFDYVWQDIGTGRALAFDETSLNLRLLEYVHYNGKESSYFIDYADAPFKEREWEHTVEDTDVNWLTKDTVEQIWCNNDVSVDSQVWELVVPNLDTFAFSYYVTCDDSTDMDASDYIALKVEVFGVDADDGGLHDVLQVVSNIGKSGGGSITLGITFDVCGTELVSVDQVQDTDGLFVSVAMSLKEDRSVLDANFITGWDLTDETDYITYLGSGDISDQVTDPSQEFLIRITYSVNLIGDTEVQAWFTEMSMIQDRIFSDQFINQMREDGAGTHWLAEIFISIAAAIAAFFKPFMDPIVNALGNLVTNIWNGIGTALDFITLAIAGIWALLVVALEDIIGGLLLLAEDAADLLFAIIDYLIVLVLDIVEEIWTVIERTIFFIWDALNLPNIIEMFNLLLAYIVELVQWLVTTIQETIQLFDDLSWVILVGWWIWALPIQWARAGGNPLAGLGNFVEVYFYDLIPWTLFGIHVYVPQGIAATLWMILLLPETFVLFTALGI